jgi:hypothetical protein
MRRLHWVVLLVTLSLVGIGETGANRRMEMAKSDQVSACPVSVTSTAGGETVAQKDCCKGHKGVCGCRAGKIVCCDKTFSDTCTCNRDEAPDGVH